MIPVSTYILFGVLIFNGVPVPVSTEFNGLATCTVAKQTKERQGTALLDCVRK